MATFSEDQCIALIVQDTPKLPLPQPGQGLGGERGRPTREQGPPVNAASFLEGAWLSDPTSRNTFSSPSPLRCLTAPLPNPGPAGTLGFDPGNYRACLHPLLPPSPNQPRGSGWKWPPLGHTVHFIAHLHQRELLSFSSPQ